MTRLIVLALLVAVLWLALDRAVMRRLRGAGRVGRGGGGAAAGRPAVTETLVRCARCGVHLPRSRALAGDGEGLYCSAACREAEAQGG